MAKSRKSMAGKAKERADKRESSSGGFKFNLPEGTTFYTPTLPKKGQSWNEQIDILPYEVSVKNNPEQTKGELWYERTIFVHYNVGIDDSTILCPKTIGKPCPICEEMARMKKDSSADEDDIKALKPKERQIFNVRDPEDPDTLMLFESSYFTFGEKLEEEYSSKPEYGGFADMEGGMTLDIRFKKKKIGKNPFAEASRIDFEERDDLDEDILEEVIDLDAILNVLSYEAVECMFLGLVNNEEEENDGDKKEETPKKEKKEKKPAKKEKKEKKKPSLDKDELLDMSKFKMKKFIQEHEIDIDVDQDKDELRDELAKELDIDLDGSGDDEVKLSLEELVDMSKNVMKRFIKDNDLNIKKSDKMDKDELREALAKMYDLELPGSDDDNGDNKCPHGHTFGDDNDEKDECDDCNVWGKCKDASES